MSPILRGCEANQRQLVALGFSLSICYGTSVGLGRHEADLPSEWRSPLRKSEYAFSVLYVWEIASPSLYTIHADCVEESCFDGYKDFDPGVVLATGAGGASLSPTLLVDAIGGQCRRLSPYFRQRLPMSPIRCNI